MIDQFHFEKSQFNRLFPFYILINDNLTVVDYGHTLQKMFPDKTNQLFQQHFTLKRPFDALATFDSLKNIAGQQVIVECKHINKIILRGQIEYLSVKNEILFLVSPWFGSIEEVVENNLTLDDFAYHDPLIDMLQILKTQEVSGDDLRHLLKTVSQQKNELKKANKEIYDIALFPQQNPDPLIRINLEGELVRTNPAAELITDLEFENKLYTLPEFLKYIAPKIDSTDQRWTFEAKSAEKVYSFVCKTLIDSGHINIYGRDITAFKKNQQELEKLSYIVQHTTNAVIITDAKGKIEWVNDAFTDITGYTLQETMGKTPGSLLQGKDTNLATVAEIREKIRNGIAFTNEIFNYKKNGETYWLRINAQPVYDNAGNLTQFFAIEEDISKEKEAEQKLKEFDERLHLAMQKMGDNVWEHDFLTNHTNFSQKEFDLLGYSADEHSNNVDLWYNCVHPDDKKQLLDNDVLYKRSLIANHSLEYRVIDKKGVTKWVLDRGVVIEKRPDGTPLRIIGTHTDITEKKAIEKALEESASRMSSLITNLQSGIMLENEDRTISLINKRFCELFSMTIGTSELIGMDCGVATEQAKHKFLHPDEYMNRVNEIFVKRETTIGDKLELANGKIFERNLIPIWNQDVYAGTLWMFNDITEKLNAEKKLEHLRVFYEEILDNIPSDIAMFDSDHRYLYLNPKAVKDETLRKWMIGKKDEDYAAIKNLPQ